MVRYEICISCKKQHFYYYDKLVIGLAKSLYYFLSQLQLLILRVDVVVHWLVIFVLVNKFSSIFQQSLSKISQRPILSFTLSSLLNPPAPEGVVCQCHPGILWIPAALFLCGLSYFTQSQAFFFLNLALVLVKHTLRYLSEFQCIVGLLFDT